MVILLRVPIEDLIEAVMHFIKESLVYAKELCIKHPKKHSFSSSKGKFVKVKAGLAQLDASLCLLLYTFIVHTYDYYENKEFADTVKAKNMVSIWKNMCRLTKSVFFLPSLSEW